MSELGVSGQDCTLSGSLMTLIFLNYCQGLFSVRSTTVKAVCGFWPHFRFTHRKNCRRVRWCMKSASPAQSIPLRWDQSDEDQSKPTHYVTEVSCRASWNPRKRDSLPAKKRSGSILLLSVAFREKAQRLDCPCGKDVARHEAAFRGPEATGSTGLSKNCVLVWNYPPLFLLRVVLNP